MGIQKMLPIKYWESEKGLILLRGWARDGEQMAEIARKMNISVSTLYSWKKQSLLIASALMYDKQAAEYELEETLLKRAKGYEVQEEKVFKCKKVFYDSLDRRCEEEELKSKFVEVHIPADTKALEMSLNNLRPEKWRKNAGKEKLEREKFNHQKEIDKEKYW